MKYTFSENIQGFLVIGIRKILSFIPLKMRYKFFENLGLLAYYLIKKRRELTIGNIKNAFPEKSDGKNDNDVYLFGRNYEKWEYSCGK